MSIGKVIVAAACACVLLLGRSAGAQLTTDEQRCVDCYNNKVRLVGRQAGKDYRSCIKAASRNILDAQACVTLDYGSRIAGEAKIGKCYDLGKCNGSEPIQQGAVAGSDAMIDSSQDLVHDVFGDPIAGVVLPGAAAARCQDKAYQRAEQLFTEKLKVFRKCKKDGMKAGTVTDSATLENQCITPDIPDGSGKIARKRVKLAGDVNAVCAGLPLATLFQGVCSDSSTTALLGTCIETRVGCRVCEALNAADGMARNCDLFDDGVANFSCGCGTAGGQAVGDSCWFLGGVGASCDTTCAAAGLSYDPATETYAGSGGSLANCTAVSAALGGPAASDVPDCALYEGYGGIEPQPGLGCHLNIFDVILPFTARCISPATTAVAAGVGFYSLDIRRLCACQ